MSALMITRADSPFVATTTPSRWESRSPITILAAGCSDGVQVVGDAYGVRIGPGNEFTGIRQGSCGAHVDPIQFYGGTATVVTGNYFHDNGDGSGGIMSPDGDDSYTVKNNVFAETGAYPYAIAGGGCANCVYTHNVFINAGAVIGTGNGGSVSTNGIARDNVFQNTRLFIEDCPTCTATHNLNAGVRAPATSRAGQASSAAPNPRPTRATG